MHHVDARHHLEQFAGHVGCGSGPAPRCHAELARIGLSMGDELRNRLGLYGWIHHQDTRRARDARDRRYIADEVEIEIVVKRGVDRVCWSYHQQRMAVGRRAHHGLGCDVGAGPWPVFYDKWLAEPLREPLTHQARENVDPAAGGEADVPALAATDRVAPWPSATRHDAFAPPFSRFSR